MKTISSFSPVLKFVCGSSSGFGSGRGYGNCSGSCSKIVAKRSKNTNRPSQKGSEPAPPRITTNVKHSLQVLKHWNKRKAGTPKPATSYRRKKAEKEDLPEDDSELYLDPSLPLDDTDQGIEIGVPVLLVDGYNVCGYWAKLKKHFMKGRLEIARDKLIADLVTFSTVREMKVVVVFDAMMSGHSTHKETFHGVDIVFTGDMCADTWIEREVITSVTALKEDGCPDVWVVTSDHVHQQVAHGAGAFIWSCKTLVSEINDTDEEVETRLKQQSTTNSMRGKLLRHNLDPKAVAALNDLKKQLLKNESK
ncbi:uncharacterized protein LOC131306333 isoform X2 [Rhododendron vialii]|uniref:uncharacterized protein LOC131306333 isoform X2 n=1 Tax=Rhododendron vialii TaxID=182163 RepID=UPI00265EFF49|nr:uncharacterized protein LOC131306333 isoform X2 [Rhododendron vialii]